MKKFIETDVVLTASDHCLTYGRASEGMDVEIDPLVDGWCVEVIGSGIEGRAGGFSFDCSKSNNVLAFTTPDGQTVTKPVSPSAKRDDIVAMANDLVRAWGAHMQSDSNSHREEMAYLAARDRFEGE